MKDKARDIYRQNANLDKLAKAKPKMNREIYRMLVYYIKERYAIRLRKESGKPRPWTDDPILRDWRFTNIRREHDRESLWLINNISTNLDLSLQDKILNTIVFRIFSKHQTAEKLGLPIHFTSKFNPEDYRELCNEQGYIYFTNAFLSSGLKQGLKYYCEGEECVPLRVLWFIRHLIDCKAAKNIYLETIHGGEGVYNLLTKFDSIKSFMGYQLFVDLTYIPEFPVSENNFVVAGPGCKAGLNPLFTDRDGLSHEECLFWLTDKLNKKLDFTKIFTDLPKTEQKMNVMSLENCLCELYKYHKVKMGLGRARSRYKPYKKEE